MSLIYKNKLGETKKIAGYLTQRVNARWFLCARVLEDGQEYYDVPEDQTKDYFVNISPYTVYSFGFDESNTTNTPKLRFKGEVYDIEDLTAIEPHQLGLGQLKGVYQMFTQESEGDKTIYFIGDMHQDYDNIEGIVGRTIQLGLDGVIEANKVVFTVNHPETYLSYRTNGREFFMNAHLPVVLSTIEALDRTMQVAIKFGDTVYNLYDYMLGDGVPLTIGHLMSTVSYSQEAGFFFNFKAIFIEKADIVGFGIIPPAIIAPQLDNIIQDTDTVVTDISADGTRIVINLAAPIVNKLAKVLVTPTSTPSKPELVAIGTDNTQQMIELADGLEIENNTLKLTPAVPYVSYTDAQTLTAEQQAQARANIGASAGGEAVIVNYSTDVTRKPIIDTSSTISLTPVENETINGTIKLHKVAKTGKASDLNIDDQHNFVTSDEKVQIATNKNDITEINTSLGTLETSLEDLQSSLTNYATLSTVQNLSNKTILGALAFESGVEVPNIRSTTHPFLIRVGYDSINGAKTAYQFHENDFATWKDNLINLGNLSHAWKNIYFKGNLIQGDNTFTLPTTGGQLALSSEIPTNLSDLTADATHRTVTDTEKETWNNKLSSYTESDPTVPAHVKSITTDNITAWNNKVDKTVTFNGLTVKIDMLETGGQLQLSCSDGSDENLFDVASTYTRSAKPLYIENWSEDNKVVVKSELQTADAQNVKLTGDQSIGGVKNFTGTFKVNGGTITYDSATDTFTI